MYKWATTQRLLKSHKSKMNVINTYIYIYIYIYIYVMKCEWLKNESNYFVTCNYFRLILQVHLILIHNSQFVTFVTSPDCYKWEWDELARSTESTYKLQNDSTHSSTTHISLYKRSFICAVILVFINIYIYIYAVVKTIYQLSPQWWWLVVYDHICAGRFYI